MLGVALLAAMVAINTGCVAFRGNQLTKLERAQKPQAPVAEKVTLDLKLCQDGKPSEMKSSIDSHTKTALDALSSSGLFDQVRVVEPGEALQPGEFVLKFDVNHRGSGFNAKVPLFILPSWATEHYTVQAEVLDSEGNRRSKRTYDDKMTAVFWIGLVPGLLVPPCYPGHIHESVMSNIYQHSLKDMLENSAFSTSNHP